MDLYEKLFGFETMLTLYLVIGLYWLLLLAAIASDCAFINSEGNVFYGLLIIFGGAICARAACELLIVIFRINGSLEALKQVNTQGPRSSGSQY